MCTLEALARDVVYTFRMARRQPTFVLLIVLSLALGIGANTAVFSVISAAFLHTLPVRDPETLTLVQRTNGTQVLPTVSYPLYEALRDQGQSFRELAAFNGTQYARLSGGADDTTGRVSRQYVSANFFGVAGVRALRGRTFDASDNRTVGGSSVAVISYRYWIDRLGSDENVIGRSLELDERVFTIVGVGAPDFAGMEAGRSTDVWLPAMMMGPCVTDQGCQVYRVMGRLRPGVGESQAAADLSRIFSAHLEQRAQTVGITGEAERKRFISQRIVLASGMRGDTSQVSGVTGPLTVVMALVFIILLIACTNVGSLLLARTVARRREMAVRLSLGARRGRLLQQLLTESLLIAIVGALVGLLFASWASEVLVRLLPQAGADLVLDFRLDTRVLLFTGGLAIFATLLFGLAPALQSTRTDLTGAIKDGAAATAAQGASHRLRHAFVVIQLALSVLLLVGAGLFARTLRNLQLVDVGYDTAVVSVELRPPDDWNNEETMAAREQLIERARGIGGVASAAVMAPDPFGGNNWESRITIPGYVARSQDDLHVNFFAVSSDLFATLRIPILTGRNVTAADRTNAPLVAIVNEAFVRRFGGGKNLVGTTIEKDAGKPIEIVGVVRDANFTDLRQRVKPIVFLSAHQRVGPSEALVLRAATTPMTLMQPLRAIATEMQASGPRLSAPVIMRDRVSALVQPEQRLTQLWSGFAVLALMLVCLGLYGVVTQVTSQRTVEIGVRMALGATRASVLRLVLAEALRLVLVGLAVGILASVLAGRWISALLFGLSPTDPLTFVTAAALLIVTTLLAASVPARRAARLDPVKALRYE